MDRRAFLGTLGLLAAPSAAEAQQSRKAWRVGVLLALYPSDAAPPQAFLRRLRDLGYVDGQNLVIAWRDDQQNSDRLSRLAAELARLELDVIVADVTAATRAACRQRPRSRS